MNNPMREDCLIDHEAILKDQLSNIGKRLHEVNEKQIRRVVIEILQEYGLIGKEQDQ